MHGDGGCEACSRRVAVAKLLAFAKELERAGRISKASKGLLKELIVHENLEVISIGERLASADGAEQHCAALDVLDAQIKKRASKSHQELFEICPLEQAHLLSQQDTEALAEGSDIKSLVYGEIDFQSFYDVIKTAARGIDTTARKSCAERPSEAPTKEQEGAQLEGGDYGDRDGQDDEKGGELGTRWDGGRGDDGNIQRCGVADEQEEGRGKEGREEEGRGSGDRASVRDEHEMGPVGSGDRREASTRSRAKELERRSMVAIDGGIGREKREGQEGEAEERGGGGGGREGGEKGGLKFYDLGSGSGKAVFAAVLAADFRSAVGIEVLAGVFRASTRVLKRYRKLVEPVLGSPAEIELLHGSFLDRACDWSDGDLVFANSTCFAEDTMLAIAGRAELLRPGARVVTFTTALKTAWLRVLTKRRYQMSWGPATVFVHQKLSAEEFATRLTETTPFDEDQGIPQSTSTTGGDKSVTTMNGNGGTHKGSEMFSPLSPTVAAASAASAAAAGAEQSALFAPAWSLPSETMARREECTDLHHHDDDDDSYDNTVKKHDDKDQGGEETEDVQTRRPCCLSSPQRPSPC